MARAPPTSRSWRSRASRAPRLPRRRREAVSAATGAAEAFPGRRAAAAGGRFAVGSADPRAPLGIYTWFVDNVISVIPTRPGVVVLAEVAIGSRSSEGSSRSRRRRHRWRCALMFTISAMRSGRSSGTSSRRSPSWRGGQDVEPRLLGDAVAQALVEPHEDRAAHAPVRRLTGLRARPQGGMAAASGQLCASLSGDPAHA